jgi:hypothetical protein
MSRLDVGVVCALPAESATLERAGPPRDLRLVVSGVGPLRAAHAAQGLIDAGVGALASWGVAAGLEMGLDSGVVVLATAVRRLAQEVVLPTDAGWRARLRARAQALPAVREGVVVSVEEVLRDAGAKRGAAAVGTVADMESAAVAEVARACGLPFLAVRAVVDPLEFELPHAALAGIREDGSPDHLRLACAAARRPRELVGLAALGLRYRRALAALRALAKAAGPGLALTGEHRECV